MNRKHLYPGDLVKMSRSCHVPVTIEMWGIGIYLERIKQKKAFSFKTETVDRIYWFSKDKICNMPVGITYDIISRNDE